LPGTDPYGQGVPYALLSDVPNAQTATTGIVDALTPKVVMTFASASVRGATIATPVAGMVTWLQDIRQLQLYDGTTWSTIASGSSTWTTIALGSGYTHNGNSQGNVQYRVVNLFGESAIMLRGGANVTYSGNVAPNSGVINASPLPTAARPTTLRTISIPVSAVDSNTLSMKLDLQTSGNLVLTGVSSVAKPPWIGLNGTFTSL
jgi:hypothetical protein